MVASEVLNINPPLEHKPVGILNALAMTPTSTCSSRLTSNRNLSIKIQYGNSGADDKIKMTSIRGGVVENL